MLSKGIQEESQETLMTTFGFLENSFRSLKFLLLSKSYLVVLDKIELIATLQSSLQL